MRVTSKGQVTIPQWIREAADIMPGSDVEFAMDGGEITLRKVRSGEGIGRFLEQMRGQGDVDMTTDEIMALTRGED